jgi:cysteine-rich repeat protein
MLLCVMVSALAAVPAGAGVFIDASESNPGRITHPTGYTGSGGTLTVDVCIDSTSANAGNMVVPVQNAISTWNNLTVHRSNLVFGDNVPFGTIDFESVALHELGHCIGLAHSNLATESGLASGDQDYTKSGNGSGGFDLDDGVDNAIATGDDQRGDDQSLHWYEKNHNNPFFIMGSVVDSNSYTQSLSSLPPGDSFAAVFNTEAVMNQGTMNGEEQRLLVADDVSALRLAQSGLDSIAGNGDDYTLVLNYAGSSPNPSCDINIDFDNGQTDFAVCGVSTQRIGNPFSNDYRITSANIYMNTGFNWFFNQEICGNGAAEGTEQCDDGNLVAGDGCNQSCQLENAWYCSGFPTVCQRCGGGTLDGAEQCDDGDIIPGDGCDDTCLIEPGWMCSGQPSACSEICGDALVTGSETCDDGDVIPGDGCDASCQEESGWSCSGEPSVCGGVCGDGAILGAETCDDGGTTPGDGCDEFCQIESGWTCMDEPSVCSPPSVPVVDAPGRLLLALGLMGLGIAAHLLQRHQRGRHQRGRS